MPHATSYLYGTHHMSTALRDQIFGLIAPFNKKGVELTDATEKKPGQWLLKATTTLEIEGQEKPAYIAEPLSLCFV